MPLKRNVPADALVLFDIDGTLIRRGGPHHRKALVKGAFVMSPSMRVSVLALGKRCSMHALVLFDIDGTLIRRGGPHHREALVKGRS